MIKSLFLSIAMLALLLMTEAPADEKPADTKPADGGPDPQALFAELDTNQDGQLSAEEIPADRKGLFERLVRNADKNSDGKLTAEEFAEGLKKREQPQQAKGPNNNEERPAPQRIFRQLDANRDGKITLDEVPEPRREMFQRLLTLGDKDQDGALNPREFIQAFSKLAPEGGKPGGGQVPEGRPDPKQLFIRLDKNGDGKVTLDEVPAERRTFFERLFHRIDQDGDQGVTLEEFTAGFAKLRSEKAGPPAGRNGQPPEGGANVVPRASLFGALDADHDGKLSASEISAAAEVIRKLDADGDGSVSWQEILSQAGPKTADK